MQTSSFHYPTKPYSGFLPHLPSLPSPAPTPFHSSRIVNPPIIPVPPTERILKHLRRTTVGRELRRSKLLGDIRGRQACSEIEAGPEVVVFCHERLVGDAGVRGRPLDVACGEDGVVEEVVGEDGAVEGVLRWGG
jgi:hypothetical protein